MTHDLALDKTAPVVLKRAAFNRTLLVTQRLFNPRHHLATIPTIFQQNKQKQKPHTEVTF